MDDYHLQNGLLYHFNTLCVPKGERFVLIREAHTSKIASHFGVGKILYNLQRYVYWNKMKEQVVKCIIGCSLCCTSKPSNKKIGFVSTTSSTKPSLGIYLNGFCGRFSYIQERA